MRRGRGRGRWNEPPDPDRPRRTQWSNSRNYNRNDNEAYNDYDNEQEYNGHEFEQRLDNRNNRSDYQDRPARGYGRNRQNYYNRNRSEQQGDGYWKQQRVVQQVQDDVLPSSYQKDLSYQQPQQGSWSTADDDLVVKNEPVEEVASDLYNVPQDLVIESRTHPQGDVVESKVEPSSKPRETKSYSRERHQRSIKQESVPAVAQDEPNAALSADSLERELHALKITVQGGERKAQFMSEEEALRLKMEIGDVIQPQPIDGKCRFLVKM